AEIVAPGDWSVFGRVDIGHTPVLPNADYSVDQWRTVADRVVLTIQDLIAYEVGDYSAHQRGGSHTGSLYVGQHEWWMESLSSRKMSPKWWPENSCRSSR